MMLGRKALLGKLGRNKGTFIKPKKTWTKDSDKYRLHKRSRASLRTGIDLRAAVVLPANEELNDWLSVHVVDFYNRISLIYGTLSEYCTDESCPVMSGGPNYEYLWADGDRYKEPTALSAPRYVFHLLNWVDQQVIIKMLFLLESAIIQLWFIRFQQIIFGI